MHFLVIVLFIYVLLLKLYFFTSIASASLETHMRYKKKTFKVN